MNTQLAILDGFGKNPGNGAVVALVSIVLVFLILGIIIFITSVFGKLIGTFLKKKESEKPQPAPADDWGGLDVNDEDAVAAVLVASIDYREETHKNIKVIKVTELK